MELYSQERRYVLKRNNGLYTVNDFLAFPGGFAVEGLVISAITGTVGTVCMLIGVFALIGVMEASGMFESVGSLLNRFAKSKRSAEATIVLSAGILSMITGVISVAIVALGDLVNFYSICMLLVLIIAILTGYGAAKKTEPGAEKC